MTDQQALQRYAQDGDADAFRQLVETYQRLVYAACRRQLGSDADVEDAVQETFIRLAKNAGQIKRNLAGWLHRCATNVSISRIRRDAARRKYEAAWTPLDEAESPKEIMVEIDAALDTLSDADRELILTHYLEGRSQTALAQMHGLTQPGVKYRLDRAVERLRAALNHRGVTTTAAALLTFVVHDSASAQVPAGVTTGLSKLGLSGVGVGATGGASALGALVTSKLAIAGTAMTVAAAGAIGVTQLGGDPPARSAVPVVTPMAQSEALPDPALSGLLHMVPVQVNGDEPTKIRFDGGTTVTRSFGNGQVYHMEITGGDPDASPATLDMKLVRVEGEVDDQVRAVIGQTIRAVYRLEANGQRMVIAYGLPGERAPRRLPKRLDAAEGIQVEVAVKMSGEPGANGGSSRFIGEQLAGGWIGAEPLLFRFTKDVMYIHDILDPDGDPIGDVTLREWDPTTQPRRVAGICRDFIFPERIGKFEKWIYQPDADGVRIGTFALGSPFAGQYPNGFNDRRPGLVLAKAKEYVR